MRDELRFPGSEMKGPMDLRKAPRLRVHFRSFFAGGLIDGEGIVMDLSTKGCKIGSDTMVQPVTELEVWFFLPDHDRPIRVQLAEVRWTREQEFGLEFLSMRSEERERLDRVLQDQGIGLRT